MQIEATAATARQRVFRAILARGPMSATVIAAELGVTPAAVRRHLDSLTDDGLVTAGPVVTSATTRSRGRPARTYVVSGAGQRSARSGSAQSDQAGPSYEEVALSALAYLHRSYGDAAVTSFVDERTRDLEGRWRDRVDAAGPDPLARLDALADALDGDGFAAGVRQVTAPLAGTGAGTHVAGAQLCQGHCPVSALATVHPDICEAETRAFSRLLGVHVQRLATIAHGDHVCTTFVPQQGASS